MAQRLDRDKIFSSFARWLAGLPPMYGETYYFMLHYRKGLQRVVDRFKEFRGRNTCPFCGKHYVRSSALVQHILRYHRWELEEIFS